jgi:hypothetical protein
LSMFFILFVWDFLNGKVQHFDAQDYIKFAVLGVALCAGSVGIKELDRGGYRKVKRNLAIFVIVLLIVPLLLLFTHNPLHWQIAGSDFAYLYLFIPFIVLWVAILSVALYLNRKQNKSTSQPTGANAS